MRGGFEDKPLLTSEELVAGEGPACQIPSDRLPGVSPLCVAHLAQVQRRRRHWHDCLVSFWYRNVDFPDRHVSGRSMIDYGSSHLAHLSAGLVR